MEDVVLKQNIMKRVHRIHTIRRFVNPLSLKLFALSVFVIVEASLVSVSSVLANMPSLMYDREAFIYFSKYALMHTEFVVQLMLAGTVLMLGWLAKDAIVSGIHAYTRGHQTLAH